MPMTREDGSGADRRPPVLWFTADTHFGHALMARMRGFTYIEEMDFELITRWNLLVEPQDTVWHLGDFAWRDAEQYRPQLNGSIHLIRGNHDDKTSRLLRCGFASVRDVHYLRHQSQKIFLSHYAHRVWRSSHHGSWHLYGHSHGDLPDHGRSTDVGMDAWHLAPVPFDVLHEYFAGREPTMHHVALEEQG